MITAENILLSIEKAGNATWIETESESLSKVESQHESVTGHGAEIETFLWTEVDPGTETEIESGEMRETRTETATGTETVTQMLQHFHPGVLSRSRHRWSRSCSRH